MLFRSESGKPDFASDLIPAEPQALGRDATERDPTTYSCFGRVTRAGTFGIGVPTRTDVVDRGHSIRSRADLLGWHEELLRG